MQRGRTGRRWRTFSPSEAQLYCRRKFGSSLSSPLFSYAMGLKFESKSQCVCLPCVMIVHSLLVGHLLCNRICHNQRFSTSQLPFITKTDYFISVANDLESRLCHLSCIHQIKRLSVFGNLPQKRLLRWLLVL